MRAPILRSHGCAAALLMGALMTVSGRLQAQDEGISVTTDRLLRDHAFGALAILEDNVESKVNAIRVTVIPNGATITFKRRRLCQMVIAHKDGQNAGQRTFAGVQLVRLFRRHDSPGVVFVARNGGWVGRASLKSLQELKSAEVKVRAMREFSRAHADGSSLSALKLSNERLVENEWHAKLIAGSGDHDSAAMEHLRFWAVDPTGDGTFQQIARAELAAGGVTRVENRLIRFDIADGNRFASTPDFNFYCSDPSLLLAAIRLYVPAQQDSVSWHFVRFR